MKAIYFPGMTFGDYTLVRRATELSKSSWEAKCKCGKELITNAAAIAKKPLMCSHIERLAGKDIGDFRISSPAVITIVKYGGDNTELIEGACRKCGSKRILRASSWSLVTKCNKCRIAKRNEFETDAHISSMKARKVKGISRQALFQSIDRGVIDSERVDGKICIVKNEKWERWKEMEKYEQPSYPFRQTKYCVGQKHGCWEIIERTGFDWRVRCECGKELRQGKIQLLASKCCHAESVKKGNKYGRLTALGSADGQGMVNCKCECGHKIKMHHSKLRLPRYRHFARCKGCKQEFGS